MEPTYRSQIFDPLGLVAGMFDDLGSGEGIDRVPQQNPARCLGTAGQAGKAMVLNGLGCVHHQLYLVSQCFQNKPTSRLLASAVTAEHLPDETLGRA